MIIIGPAITRLPLDFPGLQAEARRLAQEAIASAKDPADARRLGAAGCPMSRAFARLLADLTRPESQCFWLRALAPKVDRHIPTVGAPSWVRSGPLFEADGPIGMGCWRPIEGFDYRLSCSVATGAGMVFHDSDQYMVNPRYGLRVPGIRRFPPTAEGDLEALRHALHAAFGAPL
jgi:hypothetical protein